MVASAVRHLHQVHDTLPYLRRDHRLYPSVPSHRILLSHVTRNLTTQVVHLSYPQYFRLIPALLDLAMHHMSAHLLLSLFLRLLRFHLHQASLHHLMTE
jgi:hypothetical protein